MIPKLENPTSLDDALFAKVCEEIRVLLHAHRDALRNRNRDTMKLEYDINDAYYGEAFGVLRGVALLGYAKMGPELKEVLYYMERQVLREENFGGTNVCAYCREHWGKDAASIEEEKEAERKRALAQLEAEQIAEEEWRSQINEDYKDSDRVTPPEAKE